ncbi:hypothetical protein BCR32DRAFT_241494 [Anaeromyces robustus]|uniref:Uncharacterized protein n=1 Tax=Anaeromyces robustus TaxID=1754192 RepID=A0A1Y1XJC9_9FUNG|nr:hypothetical protein BCR32DRAFT_241494 [Anaeromyces robustus]|eukprot:ORX85869.1 hypothetical protein BCR32DRAFT_241494 [Anaeromyces robustus]
MSLLCVDWVKLVKNISNGDSNQIKSYIYTFMNKYYSIFCYILIGAYGILYLILSVSDNPIIIALQYLMKIFLIFQSLIFYYYGYKIVSYLKEGSKMTAKNQMDENKKHIKKIKNIWHLTLYCLYSYGLAFLVSFYEEATYNIGFPTLLEITSFYCLIILIINTLNVSKK